MPKCVWVMSLPVSAAHTTVTDTTPRRKRHMPHWRRRSIGSLILEKTSSTLGGGDREQACEKAGRWQPGSSPARDETTPSDVRVGRCPSRGQEGQVGALGKIPARRRRYHHRTK